MNGMRWSSGYSRAPFVAAIAAFLATGCAAIHPHSGSLSRSVAVEDLDPATAFRIIKESPHLYEIVSGRLRIDSLTAPYRGVTPIDEWELEGGAADVWDEASSAIAFGDFARAADLYHALVSVVPACADCRVQLARALIGVAAQSQRHKAQAAHLRRRADDNLIIASALDPTIPIGQGLYDTPVWIGRTNIPHNPRGNRAQKAYAEGTDAYGDGNFQAARNDYLQTIVLEPTFSRAYLAVGDTYCEQHRWNDAIPWYLRAVSTDSTDYLAWRSLAECYESVGEEKAAREAAIWAVIYNYQDADSWRLLTSVAQSLGSTINRCRLTKRVEVTKLDDGHYRILVDSTLGQASQTAWLAYGFVRAVWRFEGRFEARHPHSNRYHATFDEMLEATAGLAAVWDIEKRDSTLAPLNDPQIDRVWRIAEDGYLSEYVIFEEMAPDDPDVTSQLPYSALRRIHDYIERYVIGGLPI